MSLPLLPTPAELGIQTNNTLGSLLVGGLVAATLWGVTTMQTFTYFDRYGKDRLSLKIFVAFIWILDTFDSILTSHILYWYFVVNYLNPLSLTEPVWSIMVHVLITSITDVMIRAMFARRVFQLSNRNYVLTGITVAISALDLICGITITVKALQLGTFAQLETISTWFYLNFAAGFSGDLFVAIVLCYYLWRSRTGFQTTNSLVRTLMTYIITTGLLTSVDAALGMICYIVMPNNFIFIAFYMNLAKMYTNSYLASLNAREALRDKSDNMVSIHLTRISDRPFGTDFSASTPAAPDTTYASTIPKRSVSMEHSPVEMEPEPETEVDTMGDAKVDDRSSSYEYYRPRGVHAV